MKAKYTVSAPASSSTSTHVSHESRTSSLKVSAGQTSEDKNTKGKRRELHPSSTLNGSNARSGWVDPYEEMLRPGPPPWDQSKQSIAEPSYSSRKGYTGEMVAPGHLTSKSGLPSASSSIPATTSSKRSAPSRSFQAGRHPDMSTGHAGRRLSASISDVASLPRHISTMQTPQPSIQAVTSAVNHVTFLHPSRSLSRVTKGFHNDTNAHFAPSALSATTGVTSPTSPKRWRPWESVQELPTQVASSSSKTPSAKTGAYVSGPHQSLAVIPGEPSTSNQRSSNRQRTDPHTAVASSVVPPYSTINVVSDGVSGSGYTSNSRNVNKEAKRQFHDRDISLKEGNVNPPSSVRARESDIKLPSSEPSYRKPRIPSVKGKNKIVDADIDVEKISSTEIATKSGQNGTLTTLERNRQFFERVRRAASSASSSASSPTISTPKVYMQDACLLHKYIRTRDKSNVYERPERLRAINVGIAAAYARLESTAFLRAENVLDGSGTGATSSSSSTSREKTQEAPGSNTHANAAKPFDIVRSAAKLDICSHKPAALIHGDRVDCSVCYARHLKSWCAKSKDEIARCGSEIPEAHEQDLYLCPESMAAFEGALGTVCEAVDAVMTARPATHKSVRATPEDPPRLDTRAFVVVRPPGHHCSQETPMGFGFVNNVAVGAMHAYLNHGIRRIVIFDYDLHHGNGTQAIVRDLEGAFNCPSIFYGSIHDINSYPCEDGDVFMVRDATMVSLGTNNEWIHNIPLKPYSTESQFWQHYNETYSELFVSAQKFLDATGSGSDMDDVLVFISSGFDASEYETEDMSRHGHHVPTSFYHRFTRDACKFAQRYSRGRIISVLEGGYSDKALISGAFAHVTGLADVRGLTEQGWWNLKALDELEKATKKRRGRPARVDTMDGWLQRTMEIFNLLETPSDADDTVTIKLPPLSEEIMELMKSEAMKKSLKNMMKRELSSGGGPHTRTRAAKRAKGEVDRNRENLEGTDEEGM